MKTYRNIRLSNISIYSIAMDERDHFCDFFKFFWYNTIQIIASIAVGDLMRSHLPLLEWVGITWRRWNVFNLAYVSRFPIAAVSFPFTVSPTPRVRAEYITIANQYKHSQCKKNFCFFINKILIRKYGYYKYKTISRGYNVFSIANCSRKLRKFFKYCTLGKRNKNIHFCIDIENNKEIKI